MSRRAARCGALSVAVGLLAALASAEQEERTPSLGPSAGRVLYVSYCASCHGVDGQGDGPLAEALLTPPSDLTRLSDRWGVPLPRDELAKFIDGRTDVVAHGPREMPVWGRRLYEEAPPGPGREALRRETVAQILEYLASIQRFEQARPELSPRRAAQGGHS